MPRDFKVRPTVNGAPVLLEGESDPALEVALADEVAARISGDEALQDAIDGLDPDPALGGDLSGSASNAQIGAGAVGTTELADGAVTAAKVAADVATQAELDSAVSTEVAARDSAITTAIANLVDVAPGTLDTLNELAAALGDDPNYATTTATLIGTKATDSLVVHLAGTETITGTKTFSNRTQHNGGVTTNTVWNTSNGQVAVFTNTASTVNYLRFAAGTSGNSPSIVPDGAGTDLDLLLAGKGTGVVKANGVEVATLAGTQTLTNKTLTTPIVSQVNDVNGNELLKFTTTANSVNEVTITNAGTTGSPQIVATGDDTNIALVLGAKGSKFVQFASNLKTSVSAGMIVHDSSENELLRLYKNSSAVNYVTITNQPTGTGPSLEATGDDTNVDIRLVSKGAGLVKANGNQVLTTAQIDTDATLASPSDLLVASQLAVKTYVDDEIAGVGGGGGGAWGSITGTLASQTDLQSALDAKLATSAIGSTVQAYDADLTAWAAKTAPSGTAVGTTDAQTLTSKTLTSPTINEILDANGNELIKFTTTASAINEITVANVASGGPTISATGNDTNISLNLAAKGTGAVTVTTGRLVSNGGVGSNNYYNTSSSLSLVLATTASAVNYLRIAPGTSGNSPTLQAEGSGTNLDLLLAAKGTGVVKAGGVEVVTLTGTQTLTNKTLTSPAITTPTGIVKGDVGLGSVSNVDQIPLSYLDTDDTLAANSDTKVASQQATKAYVDGEIAGIGGATGSAVVTLTDASTIATDASLGYVQGAEFRVTLTASGHTMGAPSNPTDGQRLLYRIRQDGTGSRTMSWNAVFRFSTDVPSPTLSTGANKNDYVFFVYNATDTKWDCLDWSLGY